MKEIILNNEEIEKIKDTFENNFKTYDDDSGCLCCDFICDISDDKSIIVNCHCRRSSNCPDGKQWNFDEIIVYGQKMISDKDDSYSILELPNNENEEEAKRIDPMGGVIPESDSDEKATFLGYWASSAEHVSCKFIGIASDDVEKGVVLGSYNAG